MVVWDVSYSIILTSGHLTPEINISFFITNFLLNIFLFNHFFFEKSVFSEEAQKTVLGKPN